MEKKWNRFGILLVAALLLVCFMNLPVQAADGGYGYTIRIFAGKQGTVYGKDVKIYENVTSVDDFDFGQVKVNNGSKYYAKGIRESGKDNSALYILNNKTFPKVERDTDYVVAYGLIGNLVKYTVYYVDNASGTNLAEPETFYGSVGDKPVVAYLYIEGYQPLSYNLTKTLKADESENVFTFRYAPITGGRPGGTTTTVTVPGRTGRQVTETVQDEDAEGGAGAGAGAGDGADADGVVIEEPEIPLDTIDLDTMTDEGVFIEEPTVPLSDMKFQLGPIEMDARRLLITLVILTAVAAIAIASFWYWRPHRKKEKNDEKDVTRSV